MPFQHAEEVAPVARAEAEDPDRAQGGPVELPADQSPDDGQASRELPVPGVVPVPGDPLPRHGLREFPLRS